ncbi:MAG: lipopolysaccharide kinase InaA family protein [Planctomycetota bacterium]
MAIGSGANVEVIKSNMVRTVYRLTAAGVRLYVKAYHSRGVEEALKSLIRPSRALCEWQAMCRLEAAGIATAIPVFYGERRSAGILKHAFFAATEITDTLNFGAFVEQAQAAGEWNRALKEAIYEGMAHLTARLHACHIRHGDFHLGNILVSRALNQSPRLHLIDLHTVSFPSRLSRKARILNLARVGEVLSQLDQGQDLDLFLGRYLDEAPGFSPSTSALRSEVMLKVTKLLARRLKSRTRRCLLESSQFTPARQDGYAMNLRRTCSPAMAIEAIERHDQVENENGPGLLHPVFKNKVTAVEVPGPDGRCRLCVKEYRARSFGSRLFPWLSEARRSWIAGRGLEVRGIATPRTEAWVRKGAREFLITLFVEAKRLYDFQADRCQGLPESEAAELQKRIAVELAAFVRILHDSGIRHNDLSEQNIMVSHDHGTRHFLLIDCDTLSFKADPGEKGIMKNLVQLGHMPEDVNVMAKARFLREYLGKDRRDEWRSMIRILDKGILRRMERKRKKFVILRLPDPHPRPSRLKGDW